MNLIESLPYQISDEFFYVYETTYHGDKMYCIKKTSIVSVKLEKKDIFYANEKGKLFQEKDMYKTVDEVCAMLLAKCKATIND